MLGSVRHWGVVCASVALAVLVAVGSVACDERAPASGDRDSNAVAFEVPPVGDGASAAVRRAIEARRRDVAARPDDAEAWYALAEAFEANAMPTPARAAYAATLARDPEHPRAWYHAARLAAEQGDLTEALANIDRALAVDGSYVPAWWRRGNWLFELGRFEPARAAFERARALAPSSREAVWGLARIALADGDDARARGLLEPLAAKERGESYTFHLLGTVHRRLGDLDLAAQLAERSSRPAWIDPWKVDVRAARAGYHEAVDEAQRALARGDFDGARTRLEALLVEDGDDVPVTTMLADVHLAQGRAEEALVLLDDALDQRPDHYRLHYNRARALLALERADAALEAVERALHQQPVFAPAWFTKGRALAALARWDAAAAAFQHALEYGPDDPRIAQLRDRMWARATARGSDGR